MNLTFNAVFDRYEFRCTRTERDQQNRLGLALATSARFQTHWQGREPVFHTKDPFKAMQLSAHGTEAVRARIQAHIKQKGGGIPVLTSRHGVYIWTGPTEANGITYAKFPKSAGFAFTRKPSRDLPKQAGAGLDEPVWWTEQAVKAMQCADYADDAARLAIGQALARRHAALASSRALDADIKIPVPDGLAPLPFQRGGVAYARPRKRVLFADQMGLGKTIQACLWVNLVPEVKRVLVICPASIKRNWMKEMQKWLFRPTTIGIADSGYAQPVPDTDVVIINYDMLARKVDSGKRRMNKKTEKVTTIYDHVLRDSLKGKWDMLIVDECHLVKGDPKTVVRARMVFEIEAERMAFLSGTPMVNRPRELWNFCHHMAPKVFPDKKAFHEHFCKSDSYFDPYAGAKHLAELQEKMRLWFMVRRLKKEVLKELPPKFRQVIELPANGLESVIKSEVQAFSRKEDVLIAMRLRVELAKASEHPDDYKRAVATLTEGIKVAFEELSRVRRETAIAKIPAVIDHVGLIVSEGHKVIVFCHHREVVEKLVAAFKAECVFMHGGVKVGDRQIAVDKFQEDDAVRLIFGTIGTMGVGWTLVASSYVVMAELDWVPGNVLQAEDRAHRIGTKDNVLVQHLVLEGSLDKRMADVLVEKQDIADRALDRESGDEILAEPIMPDREKIATMGITVKEVQSLAERLTAIDIQTIHMGLRMLAGTHKDSSVLDGLTFRPVDAPLGKTLANMKTLSPRMAALGRKFLAKYRTSQLSIVPEIKLLFSKESKAA